MSRALFLLALLSPLVAAAEGFDGLRCGDDIARALVGRSAPDGRSQEIEKKYAGLGAKDLGGDEWTEPFFLASWRLCGGELLLLEERRGKRWMILDVLRVPAHSREKPQFAGSCQSKGKPQPDLWAILQNKPGAELLPAVAAWRVDPKSKKFVTVATDGLMCPRDGIATVDGGK